MKLTKTQKIRLYEIEEKEPRCYNQCNCSQCKREQRDRNFQPHREVLVSLNEDMVKRYIREEYGNQSDAMLNELFLIKELDLKSAGKEKVAIGKNKYQDVKSLLKEEYQKREMPFVLYDNYDDSWD